MAKLICKNCGASMETDDDGRIVTGRTISGTHVLNMKKENKTMTREERIEMLKMCGIDVTKFENGAITINLDDIKDDVTEKIEDNGYVFNRFVDRRFVPAQMFHMLNYRGWKGWDNGFNEALNRKGYGYQWKVICDEMDALEKMKNNNDKRYEIRASFFDRWTIIFVFEDYLNKLRKYVSSLPVKKCKGIPYVTIKGFYGGTGKNPSDVFVSDIQKKVYNPIKDFINRLKYNNLNYKGIKNYINTYIIPLPYGTIMSADFKSAYKGAGAYYTLEQCIKYNGFVLSEAKGTEDSLELLDYKRKEYRGSGWKLFGYMKDEFEKQNFNLLKLI